MLSHVQLVAQLQAIARANAQANRSQRALRTMQDRYTRPLIQFSFIRLRPYFIRVFELRYSRPEAEIGQQSNLRPSPLFKLPAEILLSILHSLSWTSCINLAMTSKYSARFISDTPGLLEMKPESLRASSTSSIIHDEIFQLWYVGNVGHYLRPLQPGSPTFRCSRGLKYSMKCERCGMLLDAPVFKLFDASRAGTRTLHERMQEDDRKGENFRQSILVHTRDCHINQRGGIFLNKNMAMYLESYIRGGIRERELKWAKLAVVNWAMQYNARHA